MGIAKTPAPKTTRLSDDLTKPQPTDPGDAPADTWDPAERASSATPDKAQAAEDGHLTVNAVVKAGVTPAPPAGSRTETYQATGPDGTVFNVTHNYDTGTTVATPVAPDPEPEP